MFAPGDFLPAMEIRQRGLVNAPAVSRLRNAGTCRAGPDHVVGPHHDESAAGEAAQRG